MEPKVFGLHLEEIILTLQAQDNTTKMIKIEKGYYENKFKVKIECVKIGFATMSEIWNYSLNLQTKIYYRLNSQKKTLQPPKKIYIDQVE